MSASTATSTASATPSAPTAPSVHRRALITWLAIYPTVTVVMALVGGATAALPLPVRTLILTAIVVPIAVYALVPALVKANTALAGRPRRR
ncbi:hypothetical protein ACFXDJ_01190 [Streptomyces sp. NPDC059443]|uniref:hypothetical protein n=1 Tax=unclassified Streptomyces TaxID=2593676 RepID=UPI00367EB7E5